jgi:hypothetical protein
MPPATRRRYKLLAVEAFGGKCGVCDYHRCANSLIFHHVDPSTKSPEYKVRAGKDYRPQFHRSWKRVILELRKCVMLCANCHGEVHAGIIPMEIIERCPRFNEKYAILTAENDPDGRQFSFRRNRYGKLGSRLLEFTELTAHKTVPELVAHFGCTRNAIYLFARAHGIKLKLIRKPRFIERLAE